MEQSRPQVIIEAEEDVYQFEPFDNGAGPMWCHGCTCLLRHGDVVIASGVERVDGAKPLNNIRWTLFKRQAAGWELQQRDEVERTREPSPLGMFNDGRVFLSVNPTVTPLDAYGGPAQPRILEFAAADPKAPYKTIIPEWAGNPEFTEHSYRSFVADGVNHELLLFQNVSYTHAEWAFRDRCGNWSAKGQLAWPWGAEYDEPQPARVCYPTVALTDKKVYFCGVGDIVEPYKAWREAKRKITGKDWDFDFRRLFYTWCPNISKGEFSEWLEISSRDATAGWITPNDLWVAPDGKAHILWTEKALDERLRDQFFPGEKQSFALNYAIVQENEVLLKKSLVIGGEGLANIEPGSGCFYITPDNRLFVFYHLKGKDLSENRLFEIQAGDVTGEELTVPLRTPLTHLFTATPRAGCAPANTLDLLGHGKDEMIRYVCLRLQT